MPDFWPATSIAAAAGQRHENRRRRRSRSPVRSTRRSWSCRAGGTPRCRRPIAVICRDHRILPESRSSATNASLIGDRRVAVVVAGGHVERVALRVDRRAPTRPARPTVPRAACRRRSSWSASAPRSCTSSRAACRSRRRAPRGCRGTCSTRTVGTAPDASSPEATPT